ncbi:MAG: hypothetical protein EZS28_006177 [Streblomastix strix]|uniref:Uncharacterized protein n=1 Tax=Streblomastix strix TaxID=222440 RepID=A0A5J4WU02_9EUKA|nr:MAG: hypothetical protein EZS28_006177 [Streblomastix strix]
MHFIHFLLAVGILYCEGFVGIDFGSQNTVIGVIGGTKNLEIVHAAGEKRISPSLVTLEGIRRFSGVKSFQKQMRFPDHTFTDIINNFGKNNSLITQHFNQSISGEEIAAISLFRAKRIARSEAETSMSGYVLVIPSYFTQAQRIALLHSSNIAGLNVLAFIESSTASAYFYGIERSRTMPINISTPYKLFTKQEIAYERQLEKERMKIDEEFLRSLNNPQDEDIQTQGSLIRRLITWIYKIIIYPFNIIKNIFNKNDKDDNNENGMSDEDRWRIFTGESNKNKNKNKEDQEKKQRNRELLNMKSKSGLSRNIDWESRDRKNVIGEDIRHIIFVDVGANQITFTLAEYHFDMENKIQSSSKDNAQSNKKDKQQKDSEYDGIVRGRGLLDIVVTLTKQGIGGNRFDEILQKTALQQILNLRIQIERIVRHAKEMLSVSPTIRETIEIPNSAFANIPGIIKSKDFDNIGDIKPHFNFSSVPIELLGGTTRIPAVQQALIRVFTDIDQDKKNQSLQQQQQDQQKDEQKENEDEYNKSKEGSASIGRLLNMDESAALGATIFAQRTYAYAPLRKDNIIEQNKQKKQKKQFDKNEIIIELSTGEVEGGGQLNIRRRSLYSIQSTIDILWNKYQQQQDIHNNVLEEKEIIQLIKKGSKLSDSTKSYP